MSRESFRTPFWLANAHLQTISAAAPLWAPPRSFRSGPVERLRIPLSEGGALHAKAWWHPGDTRRMAAIVIHGVGGSSNSKYAMRAAVALYRAGMHVVRLDLRGAGHSIPDAPSLYHAGLAEDPRTAVEFVAKDPRVDGVALVGFSLGGHISLRLAGELGAAYPSFLRAIVSISAPIDLTGTTRNIERLRCFVYQQYIVRYLVPQARAFARAHPNRISYDPRALLRVVRLRTYDGLVVAPMHGFASAEDYYARASAGPLIKDIRVPTLLMHAEDDPMVPAETVRPWLADAPPAVEQAWTARGGHVGWFGGINESSWVNTWALDRAIAFLRAH